jgi:hypothetical protein
MRDWRIKPELMSREESIRRLSALLGEQDLPQDERAAFQDMLNQLNQEIIPRLTENQRKWVGKAFRKRNLDDLETENLVSTGQIPRGKEVHLPYEDMPRPLKPPPRKPREPEE